jgi:hypothetical protein
VTAAWAGAVVFVGREAWGDASLGTAGMLSLRGAGAVVVARRGRPTVT